MDKELNAVVATVLPASFERKVVLTSLVDGVALEVEYIRDLHFPDFTRVFFVLSL